MKYIFTFIFSFEILFAQKFFQKNFELNSNQTSPILSNSVTQIKNRDSLGKKFIWFGTSKGLSKSENGNPFLNYNTNSAFKHNAIFSLSILGDTIWTSLGYMKMLDNNEIQTGGGYVYSIDNGTNWNYLEQSLDNRNDDTIQYGNNFLKILPVVVPEQNVTFDLSISQNGTVWTTSWAGSLRRLKHYDSTWERILLPPDNLNKLHSDSTYDFYYDVRPLNNLKTFSVLAIDDSTVWCGTANGINKSNNANTKFPSWTHITHENQVEGILGNWVIAIDKQEFVRNDSLIKKIWCTNWVAESNYENYGVSFTENNGTSWKTLLHGTKSYDFAFKGQTIFIATEEGLFRSIDDGKTFSKTNLIKDSLGNQITTNAVYSVDVVNNTVFIGTSDGLAKTIDNGGTSFGEVWTIYRTYENVENKGQTYNYPNPFSPNFEITRIHYTTDEAINITIEIFDFEMNKIKALIQNAQRNSYSEYDEIWNGTNDDNSVVANGVYFYKITFDNKTSSWGKILVLK